MDRLAGPTAQDAAAGADETAAMAPKAPKSVGVAALLLVLTSLAQAVASVVAIIHAVSPERTVALQAQVDAMTGSAPSVDSLRNMGVITVVLAGLATMAAYLLFAFFIRRGRTWARAGALVLVVLTLVQLLGITFPLGLTTVAQLSLGAVAVALCYSPAATRYFQAVKAARS